MQELSRIYGFKKLSIKQTPKSYLLSLLKALRLYRRTWVLPLKLTSLRKVSKYLIFAQFVVLKSLPFVNKRAWF